jgi:anti-sigma factor RsiW
MTDCPNVEMRELLPEYLNGRLSASHRAEVEGHLRGCADCTAELETIRLVREIYEPAPAIDVARIVSALPSRQTMRPQRSWVRRHVVQMAAAVSFVALGGMSLAVARSFFVGEPGVVPDSAVVADASLDVPLISFGGGVSDLEEEDLESLLQALEWIEALPAAEPAAAALVVDRPGTS